MGLKPFFCYLFCPSANPDPDPDTSGSGAKSPSLSFFLLLPIIILSWDIKRQNPPDILQACAYGFLFFFTLNFDSSPLISLSIFFWWVKSMRTAMIMEKMIREGVVSLKAKTKMNGNEKAAIIELSETNFVIISVVKNMRNAKRVAHG